MWYDDFKRSMQAKTERRSAGRRVAYMIALDNGVDQFRSLCGQFVFQVGRVGWQPNGIHLHYSPQSVLRAWNKGLIDPPAGYTPVIVAVEGHLDHIGQGRCTARNIRPIRLWGNLCQQQPHDTEHPS